MYTYIYIGSESAAPKFFKYFWTWWAEPVNPRIPGEIHRCLSRISSSKDHLQKRLLKMGTP